MTEEWGPWIEHDGSVNPFRKGEYVQAVLNWDITVHTFDTWKVIDKHTAEFWSQNVINVSDTNGFSMIRYRIRKPKGLQILEVILNDLPAPTAPVKPLVPA